MFPIKEGGSSVCSLLCIAKKLVLCAALLNRWQGSCGQQIKPWFAMASASYRIEKNSNFQKIGREIGKNRNIGDVLEKSRRKKKENSSLFFAIFSPILWISGSFYSVAGQRGRKPWWTFRIHVFFFFAASGAGNRDEASEEVAGSVVFQRAPLGLQIKDHPHPQ